jgi:hypothetical protein
VGGIGEGDLETEPRARKGTIFNYLRPGNYGLPAPIYVIGRPTKKLLRIGLIGGLFTVQLFFWLETIVQSPILPGNWSSLGGTYQFYLLLDAGSFFFLGLSNRVDNVQNGSFAGFAITWFVFALVTWFAVTVLLLYYAQTSVPISGTDRLQDFVTYGIFVGPSEELFFRVALPPHIPGGWLSSNIAFAVFHVFAYTVSGESLGVPLFSQLFQVFVLGVLFYFIYKKWSYGADVGVHTAYDLTVTGAISAFGFSALRLGLIPV